LADIVTGSYNVIFCYHVHLKLFAFYYIRTIIAFFAFALRNLNITWTNHSFTLFSSFPGGGTLDISIKTERV